MTERNASDVGRAIILGGGIAGLATALALTKIGRPVLIIERDEQLLPDSHEHAFDSWMRPGVPQLQHTHIFLARLRTILRDRHPELLEELYAAGMSRASMDELLPPAQVAGHVAALEDDDLLHLWGHRATFEYVLRRRVEQSPDVSILHARFEHLVFEGTTGALRVVGVEVKRGGRLEQLRAEFVVDASGQHSKCIGQLLERGAQITSQLERSGCAYYCRHYTLAPDAEVERGGTATNIDYLIAGLFVGERGSFSIAFACREDDEPLKRTLRQTEGFDRVCRRIPNLARWISQAEARTRVLGGAGLQNRWHRFSTRASKQVVGFFPVGDCHVQTNPIYGRGCSMAFVQAHELADVLARESDPVRRAQQYHAGVRRVLGQPFEFCVNADRTFWARTKRARGEALSWHDRVLLAGYDAVVATLDRDRAIAREFLRGQQMLAPSSPLALLGVLGRLAYQRALAALKRANHPALEPPPERTELLEATPLRRERQHTAM